MGKAQVGVPEPVGAAAAGEEAGVAGAAGAGEVEAGAGARPGEVQAGRPGEPTAAPGASAGVEPEKSDVGLVTPRAGAVPPLGEDRHGVRIAAKVRGAVAGAAGWDAAVAVGPPPLTAVVGEEEGAHPRRAAMPRAGNGGVAVAEDATPVAGAAGATGATGG